MRNIAFSQITKTEIPAAAGVSAPDVVVSAAAGVVSAAAVVVTAATVVASAVASKNKGFIRCKICQNSSKFNVYYNI